MYSFFDKDIEVLGITADARPLVLSTTVSGVNNTGKATNGVGTVYCPGMGNNIYETWKYIATPGIFILGKGITTEQKRRTLVIDNL